MKIRNIYVSNSSSSSYIVKYKKDVKISLGSVSITIDDFKSLIDKGKHGYFETYITSCNKEEYRNIITEDTYYSASEKQEMLKVLDLFNEDEELLQFELDYDDVMLNKLVRVFAFMNLFKVLEIDGEECV